MRTGLSSLTLRGRAFLAAGLTAILCAVLFGQPALSRIGVLVLTLPLIAVVVVALRRHDPSAERQVRPRLVRAGEPAEVELRVRSDRRRPDGALLVEDALPYALGSRPRFVLQGLGREWERTVSYAVRSDVRGRYVVGPLALRVADPFGLVELRRVLPGTAELTVTPRVLPLPSIPLAGGWQGSGEHRPQGFAAGSAEDVSVREYRRGDDLRRVHWRSSARMGDLMVRREEQPWEARATVLIDNRVLAHRGQGLASSFEAAVVAAASIVVHLEQHGYTVRLVTATATGPEGAEQSLEHLAMLATTGQPSLDVSWSGEQARGGVVVAVLGGEVRGDSTALRRIRHDAGVALAVVLDVDGWTSQRRSADPTAIAAPLVSLAWRAAAVGPRDRLDSAWRELGSAPARSGGSR
ncbi:DUF58 domain-containing protein [Nocardioides sp. SYSU DS0651]|uniref:DUF58 domain-containing protein n=1 Tax=Nocardioides sp. SYSU DS0651 TaxID=3415955 RepID=UPI003F4B401C